MPNDDLPLPKALRLAEKLGAELARTVAVDMLHHEAATELRRLQTRIEADEALMRQALEALDAIEPHSESIMCYASTIAEWPANAIPAQLNRAIAALRERLGEKP